MPGHKSQTKIAKDVAEKKPRSEAVVCTGSPSSPVPKTTSFAVVPSSSMAIPPHSRKRVPKLLKEDRRTTRTIEFH